MRIPAYILIASSILWMGFAIHGHIRGVTTEPTYDYFPGDTVSRSSKPERFHNAIKIHWALSLLYGASGVILLVIVRGQNRADPTSSEFAGKKELEEWGKALDKEEERRRIQTKPPTENPPL